MAEKTCRWCYGTITFSRWVKSSGMCQKCRAAYEDPGATSPSRSNRGKKVK